MLNISSPTEEDTKEPVFFFFSVMCFASLEFLLNVSAVL